MEFQIARRRVYQVIGGASFFFNGSEKEPGECEPADQRHVFSVNLGREAERS